MGQVMMVFLDDPTISHMVALVNSASDVSSAVMAQTMLHLKQVKSLRHSILTT
jgi:hypothetical protein